MMCRGNKIEQGVEMSKSKAGWIRELQGFRDAEHHVQLEE